MSETGIGMVVLALVLAIMLVPIFIGVLVATLVGATGICYFGVISLVAVLFWLTLSAVWWF